MKKYNLIAKILTTLFMSFLFILLTFPATAVKAADVFNDGIYNWSKQSTSKVGQLPIADGLNLGYAFGLAQDTSGKVTSGGDSTITKPSTSPSVDNVYFSKMNIFLNTGGLYYGTVFQPSYKNTTSIAQEQVSLTSPNFMLAPSNSTKTISARDFSILGVLAGNNGNTGLQNKEYYVGSDANGNPAFKIVGDFSRTPGSANNGTYNLKAELLLRASPSNSAIVHRELYLYNPTDKTQTFTILFGEDTKLGESDGQPDAVPIYDLGNKLGLYIKNRVTSATDPEYRLLVTNQLPDGFDHYNGQQYKSGANNWVKGLNPATVSGVGAEVNNNPNATVLQNSGDTSYILRWDATTLEPGETAHFGSTMGVTAKPYSIPSPQKTFTNETSKDNKNRIGDKLKFSLKISNNGFGANWLYKQVVDEIPTGLQIDPTSLKLSYNNGATTPIDPTDYDSATRTLTVPTNKSLTDDEFATVTFEANLTQDALNNLDADGYLTNSAKFTGLDNNIANASDKDFYAETKILVEEPDFNFSFTKQVKNLNDDPDGDYQNSITAKHGDQVEYKIIYKVAEDSKDYLASGAQLTDAIPDGIKRVGNATVTGPDGYTYSTPNIDTGIIDVKQGESVQIVFKAEVTATSAGIITNLAKVTGGQTSTGQNPGDMITNGADISVQNVDTFISVPTLIDFGQTNMAGYDKVLTNKSTDGELIVSHPTASNFKVNVAYDNTDETTQLKNPNGDILPTDDSGLIFIRQRTSSNTDLGTWQAISPDGTPIQSDSFTGSQARLNLTNYIGVGDWQMKIDSATDYGKYNGILTWSMVDAV